MMSQFRLLIASLLTMFGVLSTTAAHAVLITLDGSTTLFEETFDAGTVGERPATAAPGPGTWSFRSTNSVIEVVDAGSPEPGPFAGDQYLRMQRDAEPPGSDMEANGITWSSNPSTGTIHAEWMAFVPAVPSDFAMHVHLLGSGGLGTRHASVAARDGNQVYYLSEVGGLHWENTLLPYIKGQWQKWEVDWTIGSGQLTVTVDGASAVGMNIPDASGDVSQISFRTSPSYTYYIDGVNSLAVLDGDLNSDGFVGQDDLNIILGAWGQNVDPPGDPMTGDPSNDGFVGQDDLNFVLGDWGQGTPPALSAVPEPQSLLLAVIAASAVLCIRRWAS